MTIDDKLDFLIREFQSFKGDTEKQFKSIDKRFEKIDKRLEVIEAKQKLTNKRLEDLSFHVKGLERGLKKEIHLLKDGQDTLIQVLEQRNILSVVR